MRRATASNTAPWAWWAFRTCRGRTGPRSSRWSRPRATASLALVAGMTVWDDALSEDERRALDPETPSELDPTPDVLVVGGGVTGLATAAACVRAGLGRVLLIERERLASGPSGRAAGTLTPGVHALLRPGPFVTLARRGLE